MGYSDFIPDLDLDLDEDEEDFDVNGGYGDFIDEETGEPTYGIDPVEARRIMDLKAAAQPPAPDPAELQARKYAEDLGITDVLPQKPPGAQNPAAAPAPVPMAPTSASPTVDMPEPVGALRRAPEEVRLAIVQGAAQTGLDPEKLARVIEYESGFKSTAKNPNGEHAGYIQFNRELFEGKDGKSGWNAAAGRPEVTWEEMQKLPPGEQMQFVTSYLKQRGVDENSSIGDYYLAIAAPGMRGKSDDTIAYAKGSKAVEQNPSWDRNKDGQIEVGEIKRVMGSDGALPAGTPSLAPQGQAPQQQGPYIPEVPGMLPHQVTMSGQMLSPEQIRQQQQRIGDDTMMQAGILQMAAKAKIDGRNEAFAQVDANHQQFQRDSQYKQMHDNAVRNAASQKINEVLREPVGKVEPLRVIKNMSAGDMVLGAIALMFSSVGQSLQNAGGMGPQKNLAYEALNQHLDADVDAQKDALDRGERSRNNRVAHWTRVLNDAQSGVDAARAEAYTAAARRTEMLAKLNVENADIQASAMASTGDLMSRAGALMQGVEDREAQRLSVVYQPPKVPAPAPVGPVPVSVPGRDGGPDVDPIQRDPQLRARLVQEYHAMRPALQVKALGDYESDLSNVEELKRARDRLRSLYGANPDERGKYSQDGDYGSTATGTALNPQNWGLFSDKRDRQIEKAWGTIQLASRMGWKTEPNNKEAQDLFQDLDVPSRDTDVPEVLEELDRKIGLLERGVKGSALPAVRAYYYSQNTAPPGVQPVTGPSVRR